MGSPLGGILGAFANNTIAPILYNKQAGKNLNWLGSNFKGDNTAYQNALDAFTKSNADVTGRMHDNSLTAQNDYNNLYQANQNYDPLSTYASIRSGNLNALKDYSGQLENAGSRNDKLALAAMGMAGNPNSSYGSILRADRVSQNMAPVLGNIMSSLGNDTAMIGNQRAQNLGNLSNLIDLRTNAPMIGYGMQMDPANALNAIRMNQLGQLGNTVDIAKNNTAGFQQKTDTLGQVANSMNNFNDSMWQNVGNALSVYSSLYGGGAGGMMGGMGGGGGGGGGGIKTGSAPVGNGTFSMNAGGGGSMPSMGGGGGGGGIDVNTILSLVKMFQGGGGGMGGGVASPQQPTNYNPWSNYGGSDAYGTPPWTP
jgi:hypothetical protein